MFVCHVCHVGVPSCFAVFESCLCDFLFVLLVLHLVALCLCVSVFDFLFVLLVFHLVALCLCVSMFDFLFVMLVFHLVELCLNAILM